MQDRLVDIDLVLQVIIDTSSVLQVALDTGSIHQVFKKMFEKWRELPPPLIFFFGNVDIPLCYLVQLSCDNMINLQIIFKIIKAFSKEKNRLSQKPYRRGGLCSNAFPCPTYHHYLGVS